MTADFWIGMVFGVLCGIIGQVIGYLIAEEKER